MADLNLTNLAAILDSLQDQDGSLPRYVYKYETEHDANGDGTPDSGWYRFALAGDSNNPYLYVRETLDETGGTVLFTGDDVIIVDGATNEANAGAGADTYIITSISGVGNRISDSAGQNKIIIDPNLSADYVGISSLGGARTLWILDAVKQDVLDEDGLTKEAAIEQSEAGNFVPTKYYAEHLRVPGTDNFTFQIGATGDAMTADDFVAQYGDGFSPVMDEGSDHTVELLIGNTITVTSDDLSYGDVDGSTITYEITTAPEDGTLSRDGVALAVGGTFTQADIDNGLISYQHTSDDTSDISDSIAFTVSDADGSSITDVTLNIDVEVPSFTFNFDDEDLSLSETAAAGTSIGQLAGFDASEHDVANFSVTLTGGDGSDNTPFEIVLIGGIPNLVLKAGQGSVIDQDVEAAIREYNLTMTYKVGDVVTQSFTHSVTITNENDNDPTIRFGNGDTETRIVTLAETETDINVTLIAEDADIADASSLQTEFYVRMSGSDFDADDTIFEVATGEDGIHRLVLKDGAALDYDTAGTISIPDGSGGTREATGYAIDIDVEVNGVVAPQDGPLTLYVEVTDVTEVPVFTSGSTADAIVEGTLVADDDIIYTASATAASAITYRLSDGDDVFEINDDGEVTFRVATTLDYETQPSYTFTVTATSTDGTTEVSASRTVTLNVTDVNDAPVIDEGSLTGLSLAYNADGSVVNSSLGTVTASDEDRDENGNGDTLSYDFASDPQIFRILQDNSREEVTLKSAIFAINASTGEVTYTSTSLPVRGDNGLFLSAGEYEVAFSIQVEDGSGGTDTATTTVDVTVPNLPPRWILADLDPAALPSDFPVSVDNVTALKAALTSGLPLTEGEGTENTDFETVQNTVSLFNLLQAFVSDPQGEAITAFTFSFTNDDVSLVRVSRDIGTGQEVITPLGQDFVLTADNTDATFRIIHNGDSEPDGGMLSITAYDATQAPDGVPVDTPDTTPPTIAFNLPVTQVDDLPVLTVTTGSGSIAEGDYSQTALDTGLRFALTDEDNDLSGLGSDDFTIYYADSEGTIGESTTDFSVISDGSGGYSLQATGNLNFEAGETLTLVIEAAGGQSDLLTITLTNIHDEAPIFTSAEIAGIVENIEYGLGDVVYIAMVDTDDTATSLSYRLIDGDDMFDINTATGEVSFKTPTTPEFEPQDSYSFTVEATSTDGTNILTASQTVTLNVTNINDAPIIVNRGLSLDEGFVGTVALDARHLSVTDVDQADPSLMTYSLPSTLPDGLTISVDGTALEAGNGANSSFTQADINAGRVSMSFTSDFTSGALSFTYADGIFEDTHTINFDITVRSETDEADNSNADGPLSIIGTDGRDIITDSKGNDTISSLAGDDDIILNVPDSNGNFEDIDEVDYHVAIVSDGVAGIDGSDIISGFRRTIDEFHLNAEIKDHRHRDYDTVLSHIEGDDETHADNLILITPNIEYDFGTLGSLNTEVDDILSVAGLYLQFTAGSDYSLGRVSMPFMQIQFDEAMTWSDFTSIVGADYDGGSGAVTDFAKLEALLGHVSYEGYFAATLSDEDDNGTFDGFTAADFGVTSEDVGITLTGVTGIDDDDTLSLDGTAITFGTASATLTQAEIAMLQFQDGDANETSDLTLHYTIDGVTDTDFTIQVDIT